MENLADHAKTLDDAALSATAIPQFQAGAFGVEAAYEIQAASINRRIERGEVQTGVKMGFTSRAKMQQMGVHDLIWGRLTDAMEIENGGTLSFDRFVHPRVEPEICFLLKNDLPGQLAIEEAVDAVESLAPALEIIDSRFENFKFSLPDVIADNASSSGYCIGEWQVPFREIENLGMIMSINGKEIQMGSSAAILGNPWESLINAARLAAAAGTPLQKGWIVLAGAATAAEFIKRGDTVQAEVQKLGSVGFSIV